MTIEFAGLCGIDVLNNDVAGLNFSCVIACDIKSFACFCSCDGCVCIGACAFVGGVFFVSVDGCGAGAGVGGVDDGVGARACAGVGGAFAVVGAFVGGAG